MITRSDMIESIRAAALRKHGTPTVSEWNSNRTAGVPSSSTIINFFGTWNRAMREAGLHPNGDNDRWRRIKW